MVDFNFNGQTNYYKGKVRDIYTIQNKWLVMIVSDRLSAFDVILPRDIPNKGQILNEIAAYMLNETIDICKNWLMLTPAPNVSIGKLCIPFKIEMVVRGNLTGHAWRTYSRGGRILCGVDLPGPMKENDYFPSPIITPSSKADAGHDADITKEQIIDQHLATAEEYEQLEKVSLALFEKGKQIALSRNLILADTKYEFGKYNGEIYLMDEVHTPDSSRYFYADGFNERQLKGEPQKQLSKEFVREWLMANNFMGLEGQTIPFISDDWLATIRNRYVELYEKLIGKTFVAQSFDQQELQVKINRSINELEENIL